MLFLRQLLAGPKLSCEVLFAFLSLNWRLRAPDPQVPAGKPELMGTKSQHSRPGQPCRCCLCHHPRLHPQGSCLSWLHHTRPTSALTQRLEVRGHPDWEWSERTAGTLGRPSVGRVFLSCPSRPGRALRKGKLPRRLEAEAALKILLAHPRLIRAVLYLHFLN